MPDKKREQDTQPKGKDKQTGEPHKPIKIPVPKRERIEQLLQRASRRNSSSQ